MSRFYYVLAIFALSEKENYMMEFDDFWEGIYVTW